jgi:hypothetical protein
MIGQAAILPLRTSPCTLPLLQIIPSGLSRHPHQAVTPVFRAPTMIHFHSQTAHNLDLGPNPNLRTSKLLLVTSRSILTHIRVRLRWTSKTSQTEVCLICPPCLSKTHQRLSTDQSTMEESTHRGYAITSRPDRPTVWTPCVPTTMALHRPCPTSWRIRDPP